MNVLLLTRFGRIGASSRLRSLQYVPFVERSGHSVVVEPLFPDEYVQRRFAGKAASIRMLLSAMVQRMGATISARKYDVVWLEKELMPFVPAFGEILLGRLGVPMVVDYDDAIFHRYDHHPSRFVRFMLGNKIDRVMARASVVMAGNSYLANHARVAGAPRVDVIPTVVDLSRYGPIPTRSDRKPLKIGWIGTPITEKYLEMVRPALISAQEQGAEVVLIGASKEMGKRMRARVQQWSEDREVELLQELDVGLMPLPDGVWERGKCGYKLIQYMAVGAAVIASPVGVNVELVTQGDNGYLAHTLEDWSVAINELVSNPETRARMGRLGRNLVEREFCTKVTGPRVVAILEDAARHSESIAPAHARSGT